jgi:hypothetical protein
MATASFGDYFLFRYGSARTVTAQTQQNIRPDNLAHRVVPFLVISQKRFLSTSVSHT